jgi:hypothetical protein
LPAEDGGGLRRRRGIDARSRRLETPARSSLHPAIRVGNAAIPTPTRTMSPRSKRRRRGAALAAAALVTATAIAARAEDGAEPAEEEPRTELAAFPLLGANSDIGVQLGAAAFLTRVARGQKPYFWRGETALSLSLKSSPDGTEVAQQAYRVRFDYPRAFETTLRLMPAVAYERHVNGGYFGLGNASAAVPYADGTFGRRYQSVVEELRGALNVRFPFVGPFDAMLGLQVRRTSASAYPGSKLEDDAVVAPPNGPRVFGLEPMLGVIPAAGLVYDTRDDEISPRSGAFDVVGLRAGVGVTDSRMKYGAGSLVLRRYVPLVGPLVLAGRFIGDVIVGDAPFYDLIQGVAFTPVEMLGGARGLRGVPDGRYAGKIKLLATVEPRAQLVDFRFLKQRFRIGAQAFVDVGRVWSDFEADPTLDGEGLGLKYGVGGGSYIIWGEGAIIRIELAYSPDARVYTPSFPFGFYIADSHAF